MTQTSRQRHRLLSAPQHHLAGAAKLPELGKHQHECFLDALIGILFETPVTQVDVAHGHMRIVFAAPSLLPDRLLGSLTKGGEFHFAHRALQSQQQPVVRMA